MTDRVDSRVFGKTNFCIINLIRRIVSSMNVRFEKDGTARRVSRVTRSDIACIVVRRKRDNEGDDNVTNAAKRLHLQN